jgi:hypothetical protein
MSCVIPVVVKHIPPAEHMPIPIDVTTSLFSGRLFPMKISHL